MARIFSIIFPDGHVESHGLQNDPEDDTPIPFNCDEDWVPSRVKRSPPYFDIPGYLTVVREDGRIYAVPKEPAA